MLKRNLDVMDGFMNGELGKVVDFIDSVACGAMVYHLAVHRCCLWYHGVPYGSAYKMLPVVPWCTIWQCIDVACGTMVYHMAVHIRCCLWCHGVPYGSA